MIWLDADQVSERLRISRKTALALMYQMPHSVIGGTVRKRIRVSEDSLNAWMLNKSNKLPAFSIPSTGSKRKLQRR